MKSKILFCCFALLALMTPVAASGQSGACGVGLTWTLTDNTLTISGEGDMYDYSAVEYYSYSIYKDNIVNIVFTEGVTSVGKYSFNGFTNLKSVQLANTITSIGDSSFRGADLKNIDLPSSIAKVGEYAFADNLDLKQVYWDANIPFEEIVNNDIHVYGFKPRCYFANDSIEKIVFGPNVKYIYDQLMFGVKVAYDIVSNGEIEYVGAEAFTGSIWYEQNKDKEVLYFDKCLYSYGSGLSNPTHIKVNEGMKGISSYAFYNNRYITGITLPQSLSKIGRNPFMGCSSLTKAVWNSENCSTKDNVFESSLAEITFGDKVEVIPGWLCENCSSLKSLSFPESLRTIGEYAFSNNSGLENIKFNENLDSIANRAFYNCKNLNNVNLTARVVDLGAFDDCRNVTEFTISPNVRYIGGYNFSYANIGHLVLPATLEYVENLVTHGHIQNIVIECPDAAEVLKKAFIEPGYSGGVIVNNMEFAEGVKTCQPINVVDTVTISSTVEKFTYSNQASTLIYKAVAAENGMAIFHCNNINIADGVKIIPADFTSGWCTITKLVFPTSVTEIGNAFTQCYDLTEVVAPWYDPRDVAASEYTFRQDVIQNATLYVPKGREETYAKLKPWSDFKWIKAIDGSTEFDEVAAPTITYSEGALHFASETPGAEFHYTISDPDIVTEQTTTESVSLQAYYNVNVYASAKGMLDSRTTSAKLYFIDANLEDTGIIDAPAKRGVLITTSGSAITISGLNPNETVEIYDITGRLTGQGVAMDGTCTITVESDQSILLVRTGSETFKVKR